MSNNHCFHPYTLLPAPAKMVKEKGEKRDKKDKTWNL
jgi:hypothetical protein